MSYLKYKDFKKSFEPYAAALSPYNFQIHKIAGGCETEYHATVEMPTLEDLVKISREIGASIVLDNEYSPTKSIHLIIYDGWLE